MKKINISLYLSFILLLGLTFTSCEEDREDDSFDVTNLAETIIQFNDLGSTVDLPVSPEGDLTTEIKVGVSTVSSADRSVTITVDPTSTLAPSSYNLGNLVIPAGEFEGTAVLTTLQNTTFGSSQTLILNLDGVEGSSEPIQFSNRTQKVTFNTFEFCPFDASFFIGDYMVTTISPGVFGAGTYGPSGSVVSITVGANPAERNFNADYFEDSRFNRTFRFSLICGEVIVPYQDQAVGCGGNDVNLSTGPPTTNATYDPADDSSFIINVTDNVDSDCGGGPVQASYRFDKV